MLLSSFSTAVKQKRLSNKIKHKNSYWRNVTRLNVNYVNSPVE